jgi:hypothetical protein
MGGFISELGEGADKVLRILFSKFAFATIQILIVIVVKLL